MTKQIHPLLVRVLGREPTAEEVAAWNALLPQRAATSAIQVVETTYVAATTERLQ